MNESPTFECVDCGVVMKRVYNSFNLGHGKRVVQRKVEDKLKAESDMKQEMKEDFGVESFKPITAQSMTEVYDDVKAQGSFVKERMQAETERADAKRRKKQKDWKKAAMRRAPARSRERVERKKAEAAKKRAIRM
jgi:hypothetical protein